MKSWIHDLSFLCGLAFSGIALAHLAGHRLRARIASAVAGIGVALVVARQTLSAALPPLGPLWSAGWDFEAFRNVGLNLRSGQAADHAIDGMMPLHPPTADMLFAAFAAIPEGVAWRLWMGVSLLLGVALVPLSARVIGEQADPGEAIPDQPTVTLLLAAFVTSFAMLWGLDAGQLCTFISALLLLALHAQSRGRSFVAGLALALATIKVSTMLPFLLLFARRRDIKTLAWMTVFGIGLALAFNTPADLPDRLARELRYIEQYGRPGAMNDASPTGPFAHDILNLEHLITRLGPIDARPARLLSLAGLVALGGWLAWVVVGRRRPRGACIALVSVYSMLFLYHRVYDAVILALPLVYAAGGAGVARGGRRAAYLGAVFLLLIVLHMQPWTMLAGLTAATVEGVSPAIQLRTFPHWKFLGDLTVGRVPATAALTRALVLPYANWALLGTLALIAWASRPVTPENGAKAV